MFLRLVLGMFAALVLVGMAAADVPQLINYQGMLKSGGSAVTTPTTVIFAIWTDPTTGDSLWSEQKMITPNADGFFNTMLGSISPIPDSAFAGADVYLSIKIESDPEMSPRAQLTSVPFSYVANSADAITDGGGWTDDGAVVRLDNNTDEVGVGTVSPDAKLHVEAAQMHAGRFTSSVGTSDSAVFTADYVGGGDVDAVAIHGRSRPNDFWGIGGRFEGNYLGLEAIAHPGGTDPSYAYAGAVATAWGGNARNFGLRAFAGDCAQATAVYANATNSTEFAIGVEGAVNVDTSNSASGVMGHSVSASTFNYGVSGIGIGALSTWNYGVYGEAHSCTNGNIGVGGWAKDHTGWKRGVYGNASGNGDNYGVYGVATDASGTNNYGVYGEASGGSVNWAGKFVGDVDVTGTLSKSAGSFKIDHPLDPGNKYLQHSFVESPDMMNVYNGNVQTDETGRAVVTLPDYFDALNKDYRYQLTVIGAFAQAIVEQEVQGNQFVIATDQPNVKVSWQVTGVRNDPYAKANRIQIEINKPAHEQNKYLYPELHGLGAERAIHKSIEVPENAYIGKIIQREEKSIKQPSKASQ